MSMKFFRQTKETKRKLSFFMALAMVISLLPVSPVAKAEEKAANVTVTGSVTGAEITSVTSNAAISSGSALITLTADDGYAFTDKESVIVNMTTPGSSNKANNSCTVTAVTTSSMTGNAKVATSASISNDGKTYTLTVENISDDINVNLGGSATKLCDVKYGLPTTSNIDYVVTLSNGYTYNAKGNSVATGTVITIEATPKSGFAWEDEPTLPTVSVAPANSATVVNFATLANNTAKATVTINAGTTITVSGGKVIADSTTDEICSVTIDKTKLGSGIALTTTNEDGTAFSANKIAKGKSINLIVKSVAENDIWSEVPDLTVTPDTSTKTDWAAGSGKAYTSKVTINANTTITVSGGSVVAVNDNVKDSVAENTTVAENANNMTVDTNTMKDAAVVNNIINAIVKKGGDAVSTAGILEAIGNGTGTITTSFKIESSKENYSDAGAAKTLLDKIEVPDNVKLDVKAIQGGVALDISINSVYKLGKKVIVSVEITELGKKIKITMDIPEALSNVDTSKGKFYAIRIHGDEVELIPCSMEGTDRISFPSDKFSTYVITFVPNGETTKPQPPTGGGGIGSYVPTTSATPAPSATAAPSASPSADPSAAPGTDSSAAPTESGAPTTGGDTTPTKAPAATDKPVDTDKDNTNGGSTAVKVGKKATVSGSQYKVTAVKGTRTVQFTKGKKNAKSIVVPSTVKISGKNYKVTTIAKNAFKGNKKLAKVTIGKNVNKIGVSAFQNCSKLKSIIIKSTKLTAKKVGKNAFKGINKKATFKVPKSKVKAYKKIVKAKGAGKNVKVKK